MSSSKKRHATITALLKVPGGSEQPHEAFANLRDEPEAIDSFKARFLGSKERIHGELPFHVPNAVEVIHLLRDRFRRAWSGDQAALSRIQQVLDKQMFNFTVSQRRIAIEPKTLFGTISLLFLRDSSSGKLAVCANPDCHSPYFVKKRRTQKYCVAGPCTEQAQREQKRLWWERNHGKTKK